ncbi:MAG TPA: arylsulfotransferase family protein [Gaiellaceae bacterium]|nr:arylsulfotransferase family protein [Gaiellaceae bacterium]
MTRGELVRRGAVVGAGMLLAGPSSVFDRAFGAVDPKKVHLWVTRPDLLPPVVTRLHHTSEASAGHLFIAPLSGPGARGALILDGTGEPVWFHPTKPVVALNFRAAMYRGKPVLTWWEGKTQHGLGDGDHVIYDNTYRQVVRLHHAGKKRPADLHEFLITPKGTALVTAWEHVEMDLTAYGGKANGLVVGGVVQEIELPSGRVLFEWRSLDHVGLDESHVGPNPTGAWDYFHVNSIELDRDGNYLVSARNTWGIYKIDRHTGKVLWRLGGKKSDFQMGPGTIFAFQHDARSHGGGDALVSLFDDGAGPKVQPFSKALVLALDHKRKRATLHKKFVHHPTLSAHALGSVQLLPNGNWFVGWGTEPYFSEYTPGGKLVFDAKLPKGGQNYRSLKMPWIGHPSEPPIVKASGGTGYVSWNGATEVAAWRVEAGGSSGSLAGADAVRRTGFETSFELPAGTRFVRVTGVDAQGHELGTSKITPVG